MKQFNLEEYLKNPTKKVVTRDGLPVRIICTDRKSSDGYNIIALLPRENCEEQATYTSNGGLYSNECPSALDLFFAPEKQSRWIYLFHYYDRTVVVSDTYERRDEAEMAMKDDNGFALTEITWEE